jgi:hypothetical protein
MHWHMRDGATAVNDVEVARVSAVLVGKVLQKPCTSLRSIREFMDETDDLD